MREGALIRDVNFVGARGSRIGAYLVGSADEENSKAGVLFLHWLSAARGSRENSSMRRSNSPASGSCRSCLSSAARAVASDRDDYADSFATIDLPQTNVYGHLVDSLESAGSVPRLAEETTVSWEAQRALSRRMEPVADELTGDPVFGSVALAIAETEAVYCAKVFLFLGTTAVVQWTRAPGVQLTASRKSPETVPFGG